MDLLDIKKLFISPTLTALGMGGSAADYQVLFTGYLESRFKYFRQINGPALSWFQVEPKTHEDIKGWLNNSFNTILREKVLSTCYLSILPPDDALTWNIRYAVTMCRLVYYRCKMPLPDAADAEGIANCHKVCYNTRYGKADPVANAKIIRDLMDKGLEA